MRGGLALLAMLLLAGCLDSPTRADTHASRPQAYLRPDPLPDLLVEVDFAPGYEPSQLAMAGFRQRLEEVADKRSIEILPARSSDRLAGEVPWTGLRVMEASRATFDHCGDRHATFGEAATLHVLFLSGRSDEADGGGFQGVFLASAGCTHTIALLPDYWRKQYAYVSSPGSPVLPDGPFVDAYERHVLVHELGHALGLVGVGLPVLDERRTSDPCACHSQRPTSVMYEGIDDPSPTQRLAALQRYLEDGVEPVWAFDEADLADVRAGREG